MHAINQRSLFALIILFELGSAVLLDPGKNAMQDSWLAVLLGFVMALPLLFLYGGLAKAYPFQSFSELLQIGFGRFIGVTLSICYFGYFLYISARVLRDFDELLIISAYSGASLLLISICMMMTIMYFSIKGISSIAIIAPFLLWIVVIPLLIIGFLQFLSGNVSFELIKPVLGKGLKPLFQTAFPQLLTFPFGEMIVFTFIFPYMTNKTSLLKTSITAVFTVALILSFLAFIHVLVLGPEAVKRSAFPMLNSVSAINISDFLQRLDSFIVIIMVLVGFAKIAVFFIVAVQGTHQLAKSKSMTPLVLFFGLFIIYASIAIAPNYMEHLNEGLIILPMFVHLPFQAGIPLLLAGILFIKGKKKRHLEKSE